MSLPDTQRVAKAILQAINAFRELSGGSPSPCYASRGMTI